MANLHTPTAKFFGILLLTVYLIDLALPYKTPAFCILQTILIWMSDELNLQSIVNVVPKKNPRFQSCLVNTSKGNSILTFWIISFQIQQDPKPVLKQKIAAKPVIAENAPNLQINEPFQRIKTSVYNFDTKENVSTSLRHNKETSFQSWKWSCLHYHVLFFYPFYIILKALIYQFLTLQATYL